MTAYMNTNNESIETELTSKNFDAILVSDIDKPILRPLSDLNRAEYYNDELFVPTDRLRTQLRELELTEINFKYKGCIKYTHWFSFYDNEVPVLGLPYWITRRLFEWHFDVFDLIDRGLAIDINTLK